MKIRSWELEDYDAFAKILCDTWIIFRITSSYEDGMLKAKLYLKQCLARSTQTQVIEIDHTPIGLLVINSKFDKTSKKEDQNIVLHLPDHLVQRYKESNKQYQNACDALFGDKKNMYDGEIILLVIEASHQGKGLGSLLFQQAMKYFYTMNSKHFFLYSDNSCDYSFYEHYDMRRIAEKGVSHREHAAGLKVLLFEGTACIRKPTCNV